MRKLKYLIPAMVASTAATAGAFAQDISAKVTLRTDYVTLGWYDTDLSKVPEADSRVVLSISKTV